MRIRIYLYIFLSFLMIILVLSLIRVRPDYIIFGVNGCAPELIQITDYNIKVDTNIYLFDRTTNVNLYEIGGCTFPSNEITSRKFKIKIPLIMLFDYRSHLGGQDSSGRYLFLEFKLLGFIRQFSLFSKPIYFKDLPDKISEKRQLIHNLYGDSCLMKTTFIDCE